MGHSLFINHLPNPLLAIVTAAHSISTFKLRKLDAGDRSINEKKEGKKGGGEEVNIKTEIICMCNQPGHR